MVLKKSKTKKERKILCLLHFIIVKLCEAVNVKRLEIIGEQFIFSLKCCPFCNAKSFCAYKAMFLSFIGYYFTITTSIFFIFWPITNEPWAKICYQKWTMTELKSVRPFNMTGHCPKVILSPGGRVSIGRYPPHPPPPRSP